jgi:addiction module HigA family antidote
MLPIVRVPGRALMLPIVRVPGRALMLPIVRALQVSRKTLSAILNGRAGISPDMAIRLSLAFGTSAESWLNQQMQYDLSRRFTSQKRWDSRPSVVTMALAGRPRKHGTAREPHVRSRVNDLAGIPAPGTVVASPRKGGRNFQRRGYRERPYGVSSRISGIPSPSTSSHPKRTGAAMSGRNARSVPLHDGDQSCVAGQPQ